MATLRITEAGTTDFRGGAVEVDIDQIIFDAPADADGLFNETQFGPGLISNSVKITGGAFQHEVRVALVNAAIFSAAGWTFDNWGAGDFVFIGGSGGNDKITGSSLDDFLFGASGVDTVLAGDGNDRISSGEAPGNIAGDSYDGGDGLDALVVTDNALCDFTQVKLTSLEDLNLAVSNGGAKLRGDQIGTGAITRVFNTGADHDLIVEGSLVDLSDVDFFLDADDTISIKGTSPASNVLFGSDLNDLIEGTGSSSDLITGGGGKDTLDGGNGGDNFRYFAGAEAVAGEVVNGGLGTDNFSLFNTGAIDLGALSAKGIEGLDFVSGNSAATLRASQFGGSQIIAVSGSGGVDQIVANAVNQAADMSGVSFSFWTNGTDSVAINGSASPDTLTGSSQNDTVDGKSGADVMSAGAGNDVYRVDDVGDVATEGAAAGTQDRVITIVDYKLAAGAEIELFTTNGSSGTSPIDLTGNTLAQEIVGNAGANIIEDGGKGAADTLKGLGGNDTYRVFNSGDVIVEASSQGTNDRVTTGVDYVLAKGVFVELFTTNGSSGTSDLAMTGNEVSQEIVGNAGDNRLEGKGGSDALKGLLGKDSFVFATTLGSGNVDTITDFNVADDRFLLSDNIFTALNTGTLSGANFRANTTGLAQDANDHIIYETDTGKVFYDEDGTGAIAGIHFATIGVGLALTNADFSVA